MLARQPWPCLISTFAVLELELTKCPSLTNMRSSGLLWLTLFTFAQLCLATATSFYKSAGVPTQSADAESNYEQTIQVNQSTTGCTDLNNSLTNAFQANKHNRSLEIKLGEGCYNLSSSELATFSGWTDVAIVGQRRGSSSTEIRCSDGVGLTFLSSFGITFRNLTIIGCGRKQTSTSKNLTSTSKQMSFLDFWVGVYFLSCGNVTMDHVEFQSRKSQGVSVVMYNCNGTNDFNYTNFTVADDALYPSGGGMAIEFTFCQPGDTNCKDSETSSVHVNQSRYTFFQCHFSENSAQSIQDYIIPYPHGTEHVAFGKGGGLSIIFKGRSSGNSIVIDSCTFQYNSAQWGGGLYTSFGDQSIDNKVTVARSQYGLNVISCLGNSPKWMKSGGAAQIDFIYYPADDDLWPGYQPKVVRNSVSFYDTDFTSNVACWGGAVSVIVSRESPGNSASNSISFDNCRFNHNKANIAAAVDVSIFQPDLITSNGTLMKPLFKNCQFDSNINTYTDPTNYQVITGTVYANLVPLDFAGVTTFTDNNGTALMISGTYVSVLELSKMVFERNTGRKGGALAIMGNSWLVVHNNSHVLFINNSAVLEGGAVYSVHFGEHDLPYKWNCFFQYYKAAQPPAQWDATFTFSGNLANNQSNSIYTTSLLSCVWPNGSTLGIDHDLKNVFCGLPWIFDTNQSCTREISTGPSNINGRGNVIISAVPGWRTLFNATSYNDLGNEVQSVFTTVPFSNKKSRDFEVSNSTAYMADNHIVVQGVANKTTELLIQTLDPKVISSLMIVNVKNCSFGYKPIHCTTPGSEHMICDCVCFNHVVGVGCDNATHTIKVIFGSCLTYWYDGKAVDSSRPAVVGKCPYVSEDTEFPYNISYNSSELNRKVCGIRHMNRTGLLCSQCMDGLGVDANNYRFPCVKCHARYSWFFYILVELIPIALFFLIMAFFNVSATSASMNAFVFFSQIVTIPYFHNPYSFMFGYSTYYPLHYSNILEALVTFPYAIWNLDFFATAAIPGFCLHENLGTLEVIGLKYLNAFLPLVLIIACYILIQLYDQNYRVCGVLLKNVGKRFTRTDNPRHLLLM